jgi:capsid protein
MLNRPKRPRRTSRLAGFPASSPSKQTADEGRYYFVPADKPIEPAQVRRWEGADPANPNFFKVTHQSLNEDLVQSLATLMDRCAYEATINPTIFGAIQTHASDIVSAGGPTWSVVPRRENELTEAQQKKLNQYIAQAEAVLADWFESPDYTGQLSGGQILHQTIAQQWTHGAAFTQIVTGTPDGVNPISLRLHPIHAERVLRNNVLKTEAGDRACLGIVRDEFGKPVKYLVREAGETGCFSRSLKFKEVPASQCIHHFRATEPGMITGMPWMAPSLGVIAEIRTFNKATQDAATLNAELSVVFEDNKEGGRIPTGNQTLKTGLKAIMWAPPGKTVKQLEASHPGAQYKEYVDERWRDVGRSVCLPLMILRQNSSEHSYSGARLDRSLYIADLQKEQWAIERRMRPVLMEVLREAELRKLIPPAPQPVTVDGIWQPIAGADPVKEAMARNLDLQSFNKTLVDSWAENGHRPAEMVSKIKRSVQAMEQVQPGLSQTYLSNLFKGADLKEGAEFMDMLNKLDEQTK